MKRTTGKPARPRTPAGAPPEKNHRLCMYLLMSIHLLAFAVVAARLVALHTAPDPRLTKRDEGITHIAYRPLTIPRGNIYDAKGRVLATDRQTLSLYAAPHDVADPRSVAARLASLLDMDEARVLDRLALYNAKGRPRKDTSIKRWLSDEEIEALGDLDALDAGGGLEFRKEALRYYPDGELAAHVLGFANRQGQGAAGIELAYDRHLHSHAGRRYDRVAGPNRKVIPDTTIKFQAPTGGEHVHLTIDAGIQHTLERELAAAVARTKAPRAMGIVMDPYTGAILALACLPTYDPNHYSDYSSELHKLRALSDVFEPGSAFKIVTAAAALEEGIVTPDTLIKCGEKGRFRLIPKRRRVIHDDHPFDKPEPFSKCFELSSNIAMAKLGMEMGPELLESWIRRFEFGQRACRDFSGESPGIFRPVSRWNLYSAGVLPFGQEISVTMPQLAKAFSVIANGGYLVKPHVVEKVVARDGKVTYAYTPEPPRQIISKRTSDTMRELCYRVVACGTGTDAAIPEFRVGGKTGTGQIADPINGGYYRNKYTAVFAGFAPVSNPRVTAVIVIQEPGIKQHYGGPCAGPVFKAVVREALIKMNCPEDPMPGEIEKRQQLKADADTVVARPLLTFVEPDIEAEVLDGNTEMELAAATPDSSVRSLRLPNFAGKTRRQVRQDVAALGLQWEPRGFGRVVAQNPEPGTPLDEVGLCQLVFAHAKTQTAANT